MEFWSAAKRRKIDWLVAIAGMAVLVAGTAAPAQTADQAWLRYNGGHSQAAIPASVRALSNDLKEQSALHELQRGIAGLIGVQAEPDAAKGETVVGTLEEVRKEFPTLATPAQLGPHGFWLKRTVRNGHPLVIDAGSNEHGALYGAFDLLRRIATDENLAHLDAIEAPAMPIRWVDEWDNADGTHRARLRGPVDLL